MKDQNELTCKRCGWKWVARVAKPKTCPGFKSPKWETKNLGEVIVKLSEVYLAMRDESRKTEPEKEAGSKSARDIIADEWSSVLAKARKAYAITEEKYTEIEDGIYLYGAAENIIQQIERML